VRGLSRHPAAAALLGADGASALAHIPALSARLGLDRPRGGASATPRLVTWEDFIGAIHDARAAAAAERRAKLADVFNERSDAVHEIFARLDRNGDGRVSQSEFVLGIRNQREIVKVLGPGGAKAVLEADPKDGTNSFFAAADADNDGCVTWQEFEAACAAVADAAAADRIRRLRSAYRKNGDAFRALYERLVLGPKPQPGSARTAAKFVRSWLIFFLTHFFFFVFFLIFAHISH
jgi:Ca2+-binding EF-hand superfamily protein